MDSYSIYIFEIFFSLSIVPLRSIQVVRCINSSFLFTAEYYSIIWMYCCLFNHLLVERHLDCFQFGDIMSKVAVDICVQGPV